LESKVVMEGGDTPRKGCGTAGQTLAIANVGTSMSDSKGWRRWKVLIVIAGGVGLVWLGWTWWTDRCYKAAMEEVESAVTAGRYAIACRDLQKLLSWKADPNGGITFLLGSCELARGRDQAAEEAWARIVLGSKFSERALRGRMRLLQDSGRLADAERLIQAAARDRRSDRTALLVMLVPMFSALGRIDEAQRLIEDRWEHLRALGEGALEPAINLLRLHVELTLKPTPVESARDFINQDGRPAQAAEYRRKKREMEQLRARYFQLHERRQPSRDAVEMARLATRLGREFEASGFLTLAIADDPDREDLRRDLEQLNRSRRAVGGRVQTLSDVPAGTMENRGRSGNGIGR
jgi:hypothetical protein